MAEKSDETILSCIYKMQLATELDVIKIAPMTGGVSSDIYLVHVNDKRFCVKRALSQLRVDAVWEAPTNRSAAEAAWMRRVGDWLPNAVPSVLGEDKQSNVFAMQYFPPETNPVWKTTLLDGQVDMRFSQAVGSDLATIHAQSAADSNAALDFANDKTFEAIRIEPYLRATAKTYPDLSDRFARIEDTTVNTKLTLVHGDVSPKNILQGKHGPVFLDAECAWFGDPAFDLAFCLNHLLLKGAIRGVMRAKYCQAFREILAAYLKNITWEKPETLEKRACALLPALFLARVDGKSPVEYLTHDSEKSAVRTFAVSVLEKPIDSLSELVRKWETANE